MQCSAGLGWNGGIIVTRSDKCEVYNGLMPEATAGVWVVDSKEVVVPIGAYTFRDIQRHVTCGRPLLLLLFLPLSLSLSFISCCPPESITNVCTQFLTITP